ncbi:hypothetical protein [Methanobrevibacter sp.]
MTKNQSNKKGKEETSTPKAPSEKLILYEAVQAYPLANWIIVGALARAELLDQYRHEEAVYESEEIEPSITVDELNKIIKQFVGE